MENSCFLIRFQNANFPLCVLRACGVPSPSNEATRSFWKRVPPIQVIIMFFFGRGCPLFQKLLIFNSCLYLYWDALFQKLYILKNYLYWERPLPEIPYSFYYLLLVLRNTISPVSQSRKPCAGRRKPFGLKRGMEKDPESNMSHRKVEFPSSLSRHHPQFILTPDLRSQGIPVRIRSGPATVIPIPSQVITSIRLSLL